MAVVPVFNEAATIGDLVRRLAPRCPVIVVDDGSTDGSGPRAAAAGAAGVIRHPRRLGKGAALRAGFAAALGAGASAVITLDGDGQHDPADLPRLLAAARRDPDALVIGDRLAADAGRIPLGRRGAIHLADRALRLVAGLPVRDSQCGFRVYPATLLRAAPLREGGFVLETEALVAAVRAGHPVRSVPVRVRYPAGRPSRYRAFRDSARIAWYLLRTLVADRGRRLAEALARRRSVLARAGARPARPSVVAPASR